MRMPPLQGLAFATLKRTGVGITIFKGCGFLTARTTNARREGVWSAPTYFDMMIGGLREPYKSELLQDAVLDVL